MTGPTLPVLSERSYAANSPRTLERRLDLRRPRAFLAVVQSLSLDVALGVFCAGAFAVSVTGANPSPAWWWVLPAVTWVIYSVDHLRDGCRYGASTQDYRHRFCFRHARTLTIVSIAVATLTVLIAFDFLGERQLAVGSVIAVLAAAHLAFPQRRGAVSKELTAAAIYTTGIWFVPIMSVSSVGRWVWALVGLHFLAALANLVVFSLFTLPVDRFDGQTSVVRSFGESRVRRSLRWLTLVLTVIAAGVVIAGPARYALHAIALWALGLTPATMDSCRSQFSVHARFRTFGDLSFVVMVIPWLIR